MPPTIEITIVPKYKKIVVGDSLPSVKNNIITVIISKYIIEEILPEISPFNFVNRTEIIPQVNPPTKTQATNIAPTDFDKVSALAKIYEKINDNITVISAPIIEEIPIPIRFLFKLDVLFLIIFLRIKISLTFNKEYEG